MGEGLKRAVKAAKETQGEKVTIFYTGENDLMGNVKSIEARLHSHGRVKYAQYDGAISVVFTPRAKRTKRQLVCTYKPYVLIVKGWGHPAPPDPWTEARTVGGITTQETKYTSFSDGWVKDFEAWLEPKLKGFELVADYRGANTYERKYT